MIALLFKGLLGRIMEAYIDDMIVKSMNTTDHLLHLGEIFNVLRRYDLKLNAEKCAFGIGSGKFLRNLVTRQGIEADPCQIKAIQEIRAPATVREVQCLAGMAAALNCFISKSSDVYRPFYQSIKGNSRRSFTWTAECDLALAKLKECLSHAPLLVVSKDEDELYLYLAVSEHAMSCFGSAGGHQECHWHGPAGNLLYQQEASARRNPLPSNREIGSSVGHYKEEALAVLKSFTIMVVTEYPLKTILRKADLSNRLCK